MDPDNLETSDPSKMNLGAETATDGGAPGPKAWRDIWGAGHGVGSIEAVTSVADVVARFRTEYADARARLTL